MDIQWWDRVTSAADFRRNIVDALSYDFDSVVLMAPPSTPWRDHLYDTIERELNEIGDYSVDVISAKITPEGKKVEDYIFEKYCPETIRNRYRHRVSKAQYMAQVEGSKIGERFKIVTGIERESLEEWLRFVEDFHKHSKKYLRSDGLPKAGFLLKVEFEDEALETCLPQYSCKKLFTVFDSHLYCAQHIGIRKANSSFVVTDVEYAYMAEFAVQLGRDDVELCAAFMDEEEELIKKPREVVQRICKDGTYSNGNSFFTGHIGDVKGIEHILWIAQIRQIFPMIEEILCRLLERYRTQIEDQFPIRSQFGDQIDKVEDVDIGMLWSIQSRLAMDKSHRDSIELLRNLRNELAHRQVVSYGNYKKLVDIFNS